MENKFRELPSVEKLLEDERVARLYETIPRASVAHLIRSDLSEIRLKLGEGGSPPSFDEIVSGVIRRAESLVKLHLKRVLNATGVILHTNLGRAPLSEMAIAAMDIASHGYNNLEFDLGTGERGSRLTHLEPLLCQLTGAEAGLVVNNDAAAVLLGLTAVARRKEVIISRGQEVQIGGGFRVNEIMRESGAKLVEVGTTNCTFIEDYEKAITPRTAAILRVHTSNFKITGFTASVNLKELVALGSKYHLPILDDIGSGCLFNTTKFGLDAEPTAQGSLKTGASLVFFSGDKLLGGPQAGIILGKKDLLDKLKKHPFARALRIDKTRLAGLAATLIAYLKGTAFQEIPVLQFIALPLSEIERRARAWAEEIGSPAAVISGESTIGGGSLPGNTLPTRLVAINLSENELPEVMARLRGYKPPVIARAARNSILLDPRCVLPDEAETLVRAVKEALARL